VQVDFEGAYSIEGAKEVSTVMTRHVSRLIRPWLAEQSHGENLQVSETSMDVEQATCSIVADSRSSIQIDYNVQERRRQATDRLKQYLGSAAIRSSRAVGSVLTGSAQQGSITPQEPEPEAPEYDTTLQLLVAEGARTLSLQQT
jgi:hypothetical protein